ncbi:MAG: MarR family winged helix-turn-helix transcriptional regulator, partial [Bacilli bacterium]
HLISAANHLKYRFDAAIQSKGYDITVDQYSILVVLRDENGLSQTEISNNLQKNKASMTRLIDSMEKKGFVYRVVGNDARNKRVYVDKLGEEILKELTPMTKSMHQYFFAFLQEDEKLKFKTILQTIKKL